MWYISSRCLCSINPNKELIMRESNAEAVPAAGSTGAVPTETLPDSNPTRRAVKILAAMNKQREEKEAIAILAGEFDTYWQSAEPGEGRDACDLLRESHTELP